MRILKIYDGDYPWDVRVEKVSETLLRAGHEVVLVCRNRRSLPRRERLANGLEIARPPAAPGALSFPFFLNPLWVATVRGVLREFRPDLILVRDLPLAPLAVWFARCAGVPVIADLAEPYPDSLRTHFKLGRPTPLDLLVRNPYLADLVERYVLRRIDHAVVVCPEAGRRLERRGLPSGRWTEVRNTALLERFVRRGAPVPEVEGLEGRFLILFSGLITHDRGLDTALEALARLRERAPERYGLLIVGKGPARRELEARAKQLGLDADVRFTEWVEYSRLPDIIGRAQVGLLPFHACHHIDASLANRVFEYMAQRLPIVASDIRPMTRVLEDTRCGVSFPSGDARALARAVEALAGDPDRLALHACAGRAAAEKLYNWGVDGARLLAVVESFADRSLARSGGVPRWAVGEAPLLTANGSPRTKPDAREAFSPERSSTRAGEPA